MPISCRASRSSPVSYWVPRSAATMLSVGEWLVPPPSDEMAVSMCRQPFSIALRWHISASPDVACECRCTGRSTESLSALTRSAVTIGVSRLAMSLMAMESQPIAASSFA